MKAGDRVALHTYAYDDLGDEDWVSRPIVIEGVVQSVDIRVWLNDEYEVASVLWDSGNPSVVRTGLLEVIDG